MISATISSPIRWKCTIFTATMLHCLGVDHTKLTYRFQVRHYRLTDVHGRVIRPLLS